MILLFAYHIKMKFRSRKTIHRHPARIASVTDFIYFIIGTVRTTQICASASISGTARRFVFTYKSKLISPSLFQFIKRKIRDTAFNLLPAGFSLQELFHLMFFVSVALEMPLQDFTVISERHFPKPCNISFDYIIFFLVRLGIDWFHIFLQQCFLFTPFLRSFSYFSAFIRPNVLVLLVFL